MSKHDLLIAGKTWSNVDTLSMKDTDGGTVEYIAPSGTVAITNSGTHDVKEYASATVASGKVATPATTINTTPILSQVHTPGSGYKMSVSATKNITPSLTEGYITNDEVTSGTVTVAGEAYVAQSYTGEVSNYTSGDAQVTLDANQEVTIGKGYHSEARIVRANTLASQTSGTATSTDILPNETAWVNGAKITGNMPAAEFTVSGNTIKTTTEGGGYVANNTTVAQLESGTLAASGSLSPVTISVDPGNVSISENAAEITGKTKVDLTPTTSTSISTPYYAAIQATAAANSSGKTSPVSGTAYATVSDEGFVNSNSNTQTSISTTATAKTNAKSSSVYYLPIPESTTGSAVASTTAGATREIGYGQQTTIGAGYHSKDRIIRNSVTAGSAVISGGDLTINNNYSATPTVDIELTEQTTSGVGITDSKPSSGYYLTLDASSSALSGNTKVTRKAVKNTQKAGYINGGTLTPIAESSATPSVAIGAGAKTEYVTIPTAKFVASGASVLTTAAGNGYVPASTVVGTINPGKATVYTDISVTPTISTDYTEGEGYLMSVSHVEDVTPQVTAGYISQGTAGSISVTGSDYVPKAEFVVSGDTVQAASDGFITKGTRAGAVKEGSATTPTTTITATPFISISPTDGTITSVVSGSEEITPEVTAGYISSGTGGTVSASGSATLQLNTKGATTITPSTFLQTAVAKGVYTTGKIEVASVPTQTKSATPTTSAQTISPDSGKFLSEVTVKGDSNLVSANIREGVSIFNVTGTYSGRILKGAWTVTAANISNTGSSIYSENMNFRFEVGDSVLDDCENLKFNSQGMWGDDTILYSRSTHTWNDGRISATTYPTAQIIFYGAYEVSNAFYDYFITVATPEGGGTDLNVETGTLTLMAPEGGSVYVPYYDGSIKHNTYTLAPNVSTTINNVILKAPFTLILSNNDNLYYIVDSQSNVSFIYDDAISTNPSVFVATLTSDTGSIILMLDCCFDGSSLVLMGDGTTKALANVQVGDEVMTYNETTQEMESNKVTALGDVKIRNIARIILDDGTKLSMNIYHPLYTEDGWKSLTEYKGLPKLTLNDKLLTSSGEYIRIKGIDMIQETEVETYYTLKVNGNNNFYVNNILAQGKDKD